MEDYKNYFNKFFKTPTSEKPTKIKKKYRYSNLILDVQKDAG